MDIIQKQRFYLRTLYFLLFLGIGSGVPFISVFLKHILVRNDGSPDTNLIMLLFIFLPYIGLIATPAAAIISDRFRIGKNIITINCFLCALFSVGIAQSAESWTALWSVHTKFLYLVPLLFLSTFAQQPLGTLIDAETMRFLNKHAHRAEYGAIRLLGTIGWSVACILIGWLVTAFQRESIIFYGTAVGYFLLGIATMRGLHVKPVKEAIKIPWRHLGQDRKFQWFLVFIFLNGVVSSACFNYMAYFFDDVMHSYFKSGLIFGTWTIFEIPVMFYSRYLLARLGNRWFITIGLLCSTVQLFLFSRFTIETPFLWKFLSALIQGPAFAFTFNGIIDFVDRQAHDDMRATYLSLMNIARYTVAGSLAGLFGGLIIKTWNATVLMQTGAGSFLVLILFFWMFVRGHGPVKTA